MWHIARERKAAINRFFQYSAPRPLHLERQAFLLFNWNQRLYDLVARG
jgi:hypothetical protein